ncbi:MAG: peptidase T [Lachnospiraceae bacterium]|nr:peptidase T [Lachnospiraceae bacterium]
MRASERFINYIQIHTTSDENSGTHPSFSGEFDLARLLMDELTELGVQNVRMDEHAYVYGMLPATPGHEQIAPLGFIAHMDTSPDASGKSVKPVFHAGYDGGDILYPATGAVMSPKDFPFLGKMEGETLITSDGTTLLGADDKAGIAEIMTAFETIISEKRPHGELWVAFTPDEEIGEGTDCFDLEHFGAKFAYTVDGGDVNCLEYANFNAASSDITITGFSVNPGSAKDTMINTLNVATELHSMLPEQERPEHTEGHEGFYHLTGMSGHVADARMSYIIRDHDMERFLARKSNMERIAEELNRKYGAGTVKLELKDSYYNMLEKIKPHMHLIENADQAIRQAGLIPEVVPVRGGTDGARLSYDGIPCPNLGTGGFNFHGNFECITVERMDKAVEVILNIVNGFKQS